jgi:hypothetical protein
MHPYYHIYGCPACPSSPGRLAAFGVFAVVFTTATLVVLDAFTRRTGRHGCPRRGHPLSSQDMTDALPGPSSHTYFSQRLRLHYVDEAPLRAAE